MKRTTAVVLAAGKSTRMNGEAKVLCDVGGRPIISYLLDTLRTLGIERPVVVVGYRQDEVRESLAPYGPYFVDQGEPGGTGHAVLATQPFVDPAADRAFLCYGDTPFLSVETLKRVAATLDDPGVVCSLVTTTKTNETEKFGRITRNERDEVKEIIEYKNATEAQRALTEVNAGGFCVRLPWLWKVLNQVKPNAITGELYLTDIVKIAIASGQRVVPVMAPVEEAYGIDTPDILTYVQQHWQTIEHARESKAGDNEHFT